MSRQVNVTSARTALNEYRNLQIELKDVFFPKVVGLVATSKVKSAQQHREESLLELANLFEERIRLPANILSKELKRRNSWSESMKAKLTEAKLELRDSIIEFYNAMQTASEESSLEEAMQTHDLQPYEKAYAREVGRIKRGDYAHLGVHSVADCTPVMPPAQYRAPLSSKPPSRRIDIKDLLNQPETSIPDTQLEANWGKKRVATATRAVEDSAVNHLEQLFAGLLDDRALAGRHSHYRTHNNCHPNSFDKDDHFPPDTMMVGHAHTLDTSGNPPQLLPYTRSFVHPDLYSRCDWGRTDTTSSSIYMYPNIQGYTSQHLCSPSRTLCPSPRCLAAVTSGCCLHTQCSGPSAHAEPNVEHTNCADKGAYDTIHATPQIPLTDSQVWGDASAWEEEANSQGRRIQEWQKNPSQRQLRH